MRNHKRKQHYKEFIKHNFKDIKTFKKQPKQNNKDNKHYNKKMNKIK